VVLFSEIHQGFFGDDVQTQPMAVANQWYHVVWTLDNSDNRGTDQRLLRFLSPRLQSLLAPILGIYVNGAQVYYGPSPE
jgi:hypothetical protein